MMEKSIGKPNKQENEIVTCKKVEQQQKEIIISNEEIEELQILYGEAGNKLNLDIFRIDEISHNQNTLINVCMEIYNKNDIITGLKTDKETMTNFQTTIQASYLNNYYHNSQHATDVTNTCNWIINHCSMKGFADPIETYAMIIGATVHDVGHPGFNNALLKDTRSKLSVIYNDESVLENYHCSLTFQVLGKESNNILANLENSEYVKFRKIMIHIILNTDQARHGIVQKAFEGLLDRDEFDPSKEADRLCLFSIVLKTADIGHAAKTLNLHKSWSRRVTEEFWSQGNVEKENNLPVSPLCKKDINIPKSQVGFLDFLVLPLNRAQNRYLKSDMFEQMHIGQINKNKEYWNKEHSNEERGEGSKFLADTGLAIALMTVAKVDIKSFMIFPYNE